MWSAQMEIKPWRTYWPLSQGGQAQQVLLGVSKASALNKFVQKKEKNISMYKQVYLKKANVYYHVA